MASRKVTVRLDDDEWQALIRLTEISGASQTAVIQALISVCGTSEDCWNEDLAHQARAIDSKRRRRRR